VISLSYSFLFLLYFYAETSDKLVLDRVNNNAKSKIVALVNFFIFDLIYMRGAYFVNAAPGASKDDS
jgi:hypothetical protein